jgi:hypothetical protein
MEARRFQYFLGDLISELKGKDAQFIEEKLKSLASSLSFKENEQVLAQLRGGNILPAQQCEIIKKNYLVLNKYLMVYEIGSRIFGEVWAIQQLKSLDSRFVTPDQSLDPDYCGEYDLLCERVRIGAKACRAVDAQQEGSRSMRALHYNSEEPFQMNFRQLRIESCDIFVLIGVWVDQLAYWLLINSEIKASRYFTQDKNKSHESFITINRKNIREFDKFRVEEPKIAETILKKITR